MRTLLLIPALAVFAACSDSQPTAPANSQSRTTAGNVAPSRQVAASGGARAQQGLTVTVVTSGYVYVAAGSLASGTVVCPAGTTLTGGGVDLSPAGNYAAPATITTSIPYPYATNTWAGTVSNYMAGATGADFKVYALCAS
ncbi:MAG TPA: hypothetical protein VL549_15355 [Gemmatimonadales bacterium]|jgi:hypothetical protein|nr:hypothetical protein [Gemmatimonadales bacterium]